MGSAAAAYRRVGRCSGSHRQEKKCEAGCNPQPGSACAEHMLGRLIVARFCEEHNISGGYRQRVREPGKVVARSPGIGGAATALPRALSCLDRPQCMDPMGVPARGWIPGTRGG